MATKKRLDRRKKYENDANPYFDQHNRANVIKVFPGDFMVTAEPSDMLVTTLGSCVSACIRDPRTGFGGMNHFMLPTSDDATTWSGPSQSLRYGNHAMEALINEIMRSGCPREDLEIKVFGGGNVITSTNAIGSNNANFVLKYLKNEGLHVDVKDLGGNYPRRIHYFPATGIVNRLLLKRSSDNDLVEREESEYSKKMGKDKNRLDVEFFYD
tara:strand:+ start:6255 stop:6890 length:636 start_codon:yes stop_codon:yes gene_type:complete